MLEIRIEGDKHPKKFTLVTDDDNAELARLQEIIHDEIDADPDDDLRSWFDNATEAEFKEGVVIPTSLVGEVGEVLEGDWWLEAEKIEKERIDALDKLEADAEG
jgi:hypothetical protein